MSGVSKVIFCGETLIDLTADTVTAGVLRKGYKAHDKSGNLIVGTLASVSNAPISISVNSTGKIIASYSQTPGVTSGGYASKNHQLPTQNAQEIVPGTDDITIEAEQYLTGAQTIKGDPNLVPENIKSGVTIFEVDGTMEPGPTILSGADIPQSSLGVDGDFYVKIK